MVEPFETIPSPDDRTGELSPVKFNPRKPTTVKIETRITMAVADDASCGNDSCQLRFIRRTHHPACSGSAGRDVAADSTSIMLLIRSHKARSFGTASYSPR